MSLKGSLQTAALPEVLKFLADTGKSGDLHVRGSHIEGRLWFNGGELSGFDVVRSSDAVEALFQLLRNEEGDFNFSNGDGRPDFGQPAQNYDLASSLDQAQARFAEWTDIVAVVPSLNHCLTLTSVAPGDSVVMDRDQWAIVVAIGEGHTVGQTIDARQLGEFDGCRSVKVLIEEGLVEIAEPDHPHFAPVAVVESWVTEQHVETVPSEPEVPVVDEPTAAFEPAVVEEPEYEPDMHVEPDLHASVDTYVEHETSTEVTANAGDHYASLRAIIVDVDRDLSETGAAYPASHHEDASEVTEEPMDGKSALQALLAEVSSYPVDGSDGHATDHASIYGEEVVTAEHSASVDGLADRGPWPEHELASFDGWTEPEAALDTASEDTSSEDEDAAETQPSEEPINRGLLLKFLSSVRN